MDNELELPTPCDLSATAVRYAMFMGRKKGLGAPQKIVACAEDTHVAKAITSTMKFSGPDNPEDYKPIECEICYTYPERRWSVVFERGTVGSQGPTLVFE
jgi:hypothetical protein